MADLPSSFLKVNDVEVSQDAPVTESLFSKMGSNDNYLKDGLDAEIAARIAADSSEATTRGNADTALGARISTFGSTALKKLVSTFIDTTSVVSAGRPVMVSIMTPNLGSSNYFVQVWSFTLSAGIPVITTAEVDTLVSSSATRHAFVSYDRNTGRAYVDVFQEFTP